MADGDSSPTPGGVRLVERCHTTWLRLLRTALAGLDGDERVVFSGLLERDVHALTASG